MTNMFNHLFNIQFSIYKFWGFSTTDIIILSQKNVFVKRKMKKFIKKDGGK